MLPFKRSPFSLTDLLMLVVDEDVEADVDDVGLPLSTDFKSFDSTLSELPVDSLVMVTEPPEEQGRAEEDPAFDIGEDDVELGAELCFREDDDEEAAAANSLVLLMLVVVVVDGFTGEMVTLPPPPTLVLPLSFLWGELEPKRRPSSSSTLSKVEESMGLEVGLTSS